jgi:hypothetical protein
MLQEENKTIYTYSGLGITVNVQLGFLTKFCSERIKGNESETNFVILNFKKTSRASSFNN